VELLLNGRSLGRRPVERGGHVEWRVPYAPGRLEAVGLRGGRELARDTVETSGEPVRLALTPDRMALAGDGLDALPVTVSALDAQGRAVPTAQLPVSFELSGAGAIIGVGNGDANSHESEKAGARRLYNGLAQVILQSQRAGSGTLKLRAHAPGVQSAEISLALQAVPARPAVPAAEPVTQLDYWRISPPAAQRPDPNLVVPDNDMNSWGWGEVPMQQAPEALPWRLYRTDLRLRAEHNNGRAQLLFQQLAGRAEVWLAGVKLGEKTSAAAAEFSVPIPQGAAQRQLTLLIESQAAQPSGIRGRVVLKAGR